jgi:hypothetical protein
MTIEEASDFWDTHSLAEVPSRVVEIEYSPKGHTTLVAIEDDLVEQVYTQSDDQG